MRSASSGAPLRMLQHRALADAAARLAIARRVVLEKLDSQLAAARHYQRQGRSAAGATLRTLRRARREAERAPVVDVLRGHEGAAAAAWFRLFASLLRDPWRFEARRFRPPPDPVNALLSLGYTWLLVRATARLEAAGFELHLGALHEYRPGRPSLACDLIEPLRVPAVDRWALQLLNESRLVPSDFDAAENHHLRPESFGPTLISFEQHWQSHQFDSSLDTATDRLERDVRTLA